MKIIISTSLLFFSFISFGQITFEDVLSFEKKSFKEIQADLIKDYTIFEDDKEYYYFPITECNPKEYQEDSCQWKCSMPNHLDVLKSKYPLNRVVFKKSSNKNYEVWLTLNSSFGENYNSATKRATTFIHLNERKSWSNNNCKNEMIEGNGMSSPISISIQFANKEHWKNFKSGVTNNASFQDTWQPSKDSPVELRYGIRREHTINGRWKGVFINLYESDSTYHARISFDSYGVE